MTLSIILDLLGSLANLSEEGRNPLVNLTTLTAGKGGLRKRLCLMIMTTFNRHWCSFTSQLPKGLKNLINLKII